SSATRPSLRLLRCFKTTCLWAAEQSILHTSRFKHLWSVHEEGFWAIPSRPLLFLESAAKLLLPRSVSTGRVKTAGLSCALSVHLLFDGLSSILHRAALFFLGQVIRPGKGREHGRSEFDAHFDLAQHEPCPQEDDCANEQRLHER